MSVRTSLVLATSVAVLGLALRLALPVTPVDEEFRQVVRAFQAADRH